MGYEEPRVYGGPPPTAMGVVLGLVALLGAGVLFAWLAS